MAGTIADLLTLAVDDIELLDFHGQSKKAHRYLFPHCGFCSDVRKLRKAAKSLQTTSASNRSVTVSKNKRLPLVQPSESIG
jgi:hypothetical protein